MRQYCSVIGSYFNYLTQSKAKLSVFLSIIPRKYIEGYGITWRKVVHIILQSLFPQINPLNAELNPICCLLALVGAHHFLHVSRIRVKSLTFRRLMSYIYGAPILDVSRSHTTTQHSR